MKLFSRAAAVAALVALAACQQPAAPNAAAPSTDTASAPAASTETASTPAAASAPAVSAQDASLPQPCQEFLAAAEACAVHLGGSATAQQIRDGNAAMRATFAQIPAERAPQLAQQCTALLADFRTRAAAQGC